MLYPIELPGHAGHGERCAASGRHVNGRESVCHATATKAAHNFPQPWRCSMNQTRLRRAGPAAEGRQRPDHHRSEDRQAGAGAVPDRQARPDYPQL